MHPTRTFPIYKYLANCRAQEILNVAQGLTFLSARSRQRQADRMSAPLFAASPRCEFSRFCDDLA